MSIARDAARPPRSTVIAGALAALWCTTVPGCAGDPYRPATTEWSDAASSTASSTATAPPAASTNAAAGDKKKLTAVEVAAALPSAEACLASAREHYAADVKRGLALLKACAARDDALDLSALLGGPWKKHLASDEALQLMLAEVMARRGGFVEADTHTCRAAGVPIYDVTTAASGADKLHGTLVLARATVVGVTKEKRDGKSVQIATFAESSWADTPEDEGQRPPALDELNLSTGRSVFARVEPGEDRLVQKRQVVIALRLEEQRDGGGEPSVLGALVGVWRAAATLDQR